jgi:uncharacterized protein (TIGR02265 family)
MSTTNHSMFEALFDRRLQPDGAFAEELRQAGSDRAKAVPTYPTEVWIRCLEIARRHALPGLPAPDAYRKLGAEFTEGFLETLVGRMVGVAMPFMTPQSFMRRLAAYLRLGRNDAGLTFDLTRDERFASDAKVHNPSGVPGTFVAGIVDAALQRMKVQWTIEIEQLSPRDYTLSLRWK